PTPSERFQITSERRPAESDSSLRVSAVVRPSASADWERELSYPRLGEIRKATPEDSGVSTWSCKRWKTRRWSLLETVLPRPRPSCSKESLLPKASSEAVVPDSNRCRIEAW